MGIGLGLSCTPKTVHPPTHVLVEENRTGTVRFSPTPPTEATDLRADSSVPAASFLNQVAAHIQPRWTGFLADCQTRLPRDHKLNNMALQAELDIAIASFETSTSAKNVTVSLRKSSGIADFDAVALEIAQEIQGLPEVSPEWVSDDGLMHVYWQFSRNQRQAGPQTARLHHLRFSLPKAVGVLLQNSQIAAAAQRIGASDPPSRHLLQTVAVRALETTFQEGTPSQILQALDIVAVGNLRELLGLVRLQLQSLDRRVVRAAVHTLGSVGDLADIKTLRALATHVDVDICRTAAIALRDMGQGESIAAAAAKELASSSQSDRLSALAVLSELAAVPGAVDAIISRFQRADRQEKLLAVHALGRQSLHSSAALKTLLSGTQSGSAVFRTACIAAIAQAAEQGLRNRMAFWKVLEFVRHKDERVAAASILAAGTLDGPRFAKELRGIRARGSLRILQSFAKVLPRVPGPVALKRLLELQQASDPSLQELATEGLRTRSEPQAEQALHGMLASPSPALRKLALSNLSAEELTAVLDDDSVEVRAEAIQRLVTLQGQDATVKRVARLLAGTENRGTQLRWIRAWIRG